MAVLLLAEVAAGALSLEITAKAASAVATLGPVTVLCAGMPANAAAEAARIRGVAKVLHAEDATLQHRLAEPTAALLVALAGDYTHICAASTTEAKNILPRVAALLDVMILSDVAEVIDPDTFARPVYAGNAVQTVSSRDMIKVFTIRTAAFPAAELDGGAAVESVSAAKDPGLSAWIDESLATSDRPELTSARIVVSGGRGVGSAENFAIIGALADKLGAAIGASRAAVDAGYAPNDWQVGQTGKIVAPALYIACGISGAIQHLAGMKDSSVIVAINKDEDAPIFQVADYGLVGDLNTLVPELAAKL